MLGLTATATKKSIAKIKELLALKDPVVFDSSPDRPNIRMFIGKVPAGTECLDWLVEELQRKREHCQKTIVYCRRFKDCSNVYMHFARALGKNPSAIDQRLFDMVHSKTPESVKDHVVQSLLSAEAYLRVVIATKVVGLGIDVSCERIVNYGPPGSVDDYLQQIGRAGRGGEQAHAIMMYSAQQLRNVEASMLAVLKNTDHCTREMCLNEYEQEKTSIEPLHWCCGFCAGVCTCGNCEESENGFETFTRDQDTEGEEQFRRAVSEDNSQCLVRELHELKESLDQAVLLSQSLYVPPHIIHGLGEDVIQQICDHAALIFSVDDVIDTCHVSQYATACDIVKVFSNIVGDMDMDIVSNEDLVLNN